MTYSDFRWPSEMTSFWDSGLGKISDLVADKLKCRFRATRVSEKKVICLFQFRLKVFFLLKWEREKWTTKCSDLEETNYGWRIIRFGNFFQFKQRICFFFFHFFVGLGCFLCNWQVSQFFIFLFKTDVDAIWLLIQQTLGAIWVDKIDSAQSAQFSYYFAH